MTSSQHATPVSDIVNDDPNGRIDSGPGCERPGLLISIQPRYAVAILAGYKKVELRRRPPKSHPPIVVIYGSGTERAVLGTAHLRAIHTDTPDQIWAQFGPVAGVTRVEFDTYFAGSDEASALELDGVEPAAQRLSLCDMRTLGLEPPQSWRYVDAEQLNALIAALHPPDSAATARPANLPSPRQQEGPTSPRPVQPWGRVWQGIKPIAAFSLRCVGLGLPARSGHPALYEAATIRRHHLNRPADSAAAMPWRPATGPDS